MENKIKFFNDLKDLPKKEEILEMKVAKWIKWRYDFVPATREGNNFSVLNFGHVEQGFQEMEPNIVAILDPKYCWFVRFFIVEDYDVISLINLSDKENWTMEIYGRAYVDCLTRLAKKMARDFNVSISCHLVKEKPGFLSIPYVW
ncbi:MAG: hypothetical protein PHH35_00820 [Candidatus Pacebacteria bacterium]|nr:hypothetical protein [Candidatus Paceibacterota bacterium]